MARLPKIGGDVNNWGSVLNDFLAVEHNADGSLKESGSLAQTQPAHESLAAISGLQPTNGDFMQYKAGKWTNRLPNQVKTDLQITKADISLDKVDNTTDLEKPLSTAAQTELNIKSVGASHARHYNRRNYLFTDQLESGWTDFYANGTVGYDATDFVTGSSSIKLVTPADVSTPCGMRKAVTQADWTNKSFKVWVKAADWAKISVAYFIVYTSGGAASFRASLEPLMSYSTQYNGKWIELVIPQTWFVTNSGTPTWTTVNAIMVKAYGIAGESGTIWFDEVAVIDNPTRSMISITFDDGHVSQFTTARPILDKYGYKATNFTIPNYIGATNFMTQAQTDQLAAIGWDISGHHETNLSTMTLPQVDAAMKSVRSYLNSYGYKGSDLFAYPNGMENPSINTIVRKYFSSGRTIISIGQPINYVDPMRISSRILHNTDTLAAVKGWVDSAVANNEWLVLCFHKIVTSPANSIDWGTADFANLIDYIATKQVPVLPMSEALTYAGSINSHNDLAGSTTPVSSAPTPNTTRWLRPYHSGFATNDTAPVAGRVMLYQMDVPKACTIDALVFVNGSVASGNVIAGLYGPIALTSDTCAGAALVAQSASTAVTAVNAPQTLALTAPATIAAGKYYVAVAHDNTTARYLRTANQSQAVGWVQYFDQTYGAMPATCPTVTEIGGNAHGVTARCSA